MSGTRIFKAGSSVKIIKCESLNYWYADLVGEVYKLSTGKPDKDGDYLVDNDCNGWLASGDFELVEEAPSFNLKTQPWFIRVNNKEESKLAQEWLFSQGIFWNLSQPAAVKWFVDGGGYLTNQRIDLVLVSHIIYGWEVGIEGMNYPEIKLNFKTAIESVEYPEVKTKQIKIEEQQSKIAEIEAAMMDVKNKLEELKNINK